MKGDNFRNNIVYFKIFSALSSALFYLPIFVLFYMNRGLVYSEITLLQAIIFLTAIFLEIPSGVFSDAFGIRLSIIISIFLFSISFVITAYCSDFYMFAVSSIIFGAAMAILSGCPFSFLFNYLKRENKIEYFTKIGGSVSFIQQLATAACLFVGSFLFVINSRLPYILSALAFMLSLIFLLLIKTEQEKFHDGKEFKKHFIHYLDIFKRGTSLLSNKSLLFITLIFAFFLSSTIASFDMYQIVFKKHGIPTDLFGPIYCGFLVIAAIGSKYAHLIESLFKNKRNLLNLIVFFQALCLALVYFVQSNIVVLLILFCLHEVCFGLAVIFTSNLNNCIHDDALRVTVNSYSSLFTSLMKSVFYLITGKYVVYSGFGVSFLIVASILFLALVIINMVLKDKISLKPHVFIKEHY